MDACSTEQDCTCASMDLTMCMAQIVCPVQHGALVSALTEEDADDSQVETALTTMTDCVVWHTAQRQQAARSCSFCDY